MPIPGPNGLAPDFEHPALESPARAVPLPSGRLSDRQRTAVLLQAAGLLSLLFRLGLHLEGWGAATVSAEGRLFVSSGELRPGRPARAAQAILQDLVQILFGAGPIAGRGEARGAVRRLAEAWSLLLSPLAADDLVGQILEAAPFLWEPSFGAARQALAGSFRSGNGASGQPPRLWVAGPSSFRRRVLARRATLADLREWLAGAEARGAWNREEEGSAAELALSGRFRAAVAAWERNPPGSEDERLEWARAYLALGRYGAGLALLAGRRDAAALALAARFQLHLGDLGGADATLKRLPRSELRGGQWVEAADVAARVFANRGKPERAKPWIREALAATRGEARALLRARLVAAGAAWDRNDLEAMDGWLEAARPALSEPDLAWRWHQARGWRALAGGERDSLEPMTEALRLGRPFQTRPEAAALWNELGLARAVRGDLAGADRAFVHAVRLEMGCDGPRKTTLALANLAEIRLRRGRLKGVAEILARSQEENRSAGNLRGQAQDAELWARLELAQGRPEAALAACRTALAALEKRGVGWRRPQLRLLAARALGWLGRRAEAEAELDGLEPRTLFELEPEERPALLAHAGRAREAAALAAGTEWAELYAPLFAGEPPAAGAWARAVALEPYRLARLVFDCEVLVPGSAPPELRRRAVETLREVGAAPLALRLERADAGVWEALGRYWEAAPAGMEGVAGLFAAAGYPEVRLAWIDGSRETPLIEGAGGPAVVERETAHGSLRLSASATGAPLSPLLALAVRHLEALGAETPVPKREETPRGPAVEELAGESPALLAALHRMSRLAPDEMTLLIQGESGTGKELAARRIHRLSPRARFPFLAVNCAALSETLIQSDLFGHARGAFTGADRERAGVFESARGGTVFLDEIGDLPLATQGLLLRVLQEGEIQRLGESTPRPIDVRVLAATHRNLEAMVAEGAFRHDLLFRIRAGHIFLPPLRERGGDVLLIAERLLAARGRQPAARLSPEAKRRLQAYPWPGNVRELKNVLAVAAALSEDGVIRPEHLELPEPQRSAVSSYHQQLDHFRKRLVETALEEANGVAAEAARRLGISRQALSYLIQQLGIGPKVAPGRARRGTLS